MEITIDLLKSLTADDIKKISKYSELLQEAEDAVETVKEAYRFKIGENRITIYNDGNNAEYLLHEGVWQARYIHQTFDIKINVHDIFDVYKEDYEHRLSKSTRVNTVAQSAEYFRTFVNRCRKILNKEENK